MKSNCPNYHAIYSDLIKLKKDKKCIAFNLLEVFSFNSTLDVMEFNSILFPNETIEIKSANQKLKSYSIVDMENILMYKKSQNLTLKEISTKYKISKTTLLKWQNFFEKKVKNNLY